VHVLDDVTLKREDADVRRRHGLIAA
jgi:hypothetical protein